MVKDRNYYRDFLLPTWALYEEQRAIVKILQSNSYGIDYSTVVF